MPNFTNPLPEQTNQETSLATTSIQLLRHATLVIQLGPHTLLIDPMLSAKGTQDPVANAQSTERIPMVELPVSHEELRQLIDVVDAILITHTHRDHWDSSAQHLIPKDKLILCQPTDIEAIRQQQFQHVVSFDQFTWNDITFRRTGGQHGTGEIGKLMGTVSGVIIQYAGLTIYLAGDTIWCDEVQQALQTYHPQWVVLNAGAAQFLQGDPITMTSEDVIQVCHQAASATVITVHMDVVNHCLLHRSELRKALINAEISSQYLIPTDGETIILS